MKTTKTILKTLLITVLTLSVINCSKDDNSGQNIRLKSYSLDANEYAVSYNEDGTLKSYQYAESGMQTANISYDYESKIIQIGDNTTYKYNSFGQVSKMTLYGRETTITYNSEGLIATFSRDSGNQNATFEYDSENRLEKLNRADLNRLVFDNTYFTYDSYGNLVEQLIEFSDDNVSYRELVVYNYTYDSKNNPYYDILKKAGINSTINVYRFLSPLEMGYGDTYQELNFYSKNNMISSKRKNSAGTYTTNYVYIYNENNYPVSGEIENISSYRPSDNSTINAAWTYETY